MANQRFTASMGLVTAGLAAAARSFRHRYRQIATIVRECVASTISWADQGDTTSPIAAQSVSTSSTPSTSDICHSSRGRGKRRRDSYPHDDTINDPETGELWVGTTPVTWKSST
jgi:hypothetical protein